MVQTSGIKYIHQHIERRVWRINRLKRERADWQIDPSGVFEHDYICVSQYDDTEVGTNLFREPDCACNFVAMRRPRVETLGTKHLDAKFADEVHGARCTSTHDDHDEVI